ncbi:DUF3179 domain-containing protein [Natrinema sp. 1APR25-10V2]|uniref:DUF3179 domain-containing protein n=1 Tax=Natrinema sp. 1APR25-10V2 TaxID=2951081 RepID=UPI0028768D7D|nr:DUF3179 domain-containing protein [Natrinema sp. 1APR25-10V2]MDS0475531.1 DUF3179 domain-containing protein [Natrinema sp. 1APR25-10V2]
MNVRNVLPRDAIPSIDEPEFGDEYVGDSDDEVIVADGDPPRACPIRFLSYHEIVNDTVDDRPIAVTWCPICWSAVVYDRTVDGRTVTFGVSGKLADDALVMYDRETESEWKQPTGTAIAGELEGAQLEALPSPVVSWERFVTDHPDGIVLQPVRGTETESDRSPLEIYSLEPYEQYVERGDFGLYGMRGEGTRRSWDRDDFDAKTLVLGIEHGGEAIGYPESQLEAAGGVVTDTIGGRDIVVFATDDGIHAFENPGFEFEHRDGALSAAGTTWNGITGESADGRQLERVPGRRLFAFVWEDDHGPASFYRTTE